MLNRSGAAVPQGAGSLADRCALPRCCRFVAASVTLLLVASAAAEPPAGGPAGSSSAVASQAPLRAVGPKGEPVTLGQPPETIAGLLRRADVRFAFYDPVRTPRRYAGETEFETEYHYRVRSRWGVQGRGARRELLIRPRFERVTLQTRHRITLPETLVDDRFFDHPLVLHEFDHVRISASARWEAWFRKRLRQECDLVRVELSAGEVPSEASVKQSVRRAIEQQFDRLVALIQLRYQELDRDTEHGLRPLPAGFLDEPPPQR